MRLPVDGEPGVKLVPTASGDVHLVLVDEGADTAHERVPARAIAFDPSVVPLDSSAIDARERELRELDDAFVASASTLSQLELQAQGRVDEPSEPDTAVLPRPPLLTPYDVDAYDAHSTQTPSVDWIKHESETHTLEETDWIEVDLLSEGRARDSSSLMRAPAPQSDFVRGSFSQVPFTPGGEGWDAAARESMAKRTDLAERAGAAWLEEFKAGIYLSSSALPDTLQGMQEMFDVDTGIKNVEVELERLTVVEDEELPQSYDDLFIDALRGAVRPMDSSSDEEEDDDDEVEEEEEVDEES